MSIYRYFNYIHGPVSLSEHYSDIYNKHIYIFGDIHIRNSSCPQAPGISDLIRSIIHQQLYPENSGKVIDYFLETTYTRHDDPVDTRRFRKRGIYLDMEQDIDECLRKNKKCRYPNFRAHYSDIRNNILEQNFGYALSDIEEYYHSVIEASRHNLSQKEQQLHIDYTLKRLEVCKQALYYIPGFVKLIKGELGVNEFIDTFVLSKYKVKKQYDNTSPKIQNILIKFCVYIFKTLKIPGPIIFHKVNKYFYITEQEGKKGGKENYINFLYF